MGDKPKEQGVLDRILLWAAEEEKEELEVPVDPAREEFIAYLEYLENHDHISFGAYRLMCYREYVRTGEQEKLHSIQHHSGHQAEVDVKDVRPKLRRPALSSQIKLYRILAMAIAAILTGTLLVMTLCLPGFGDPAAPGLNEVPRRYLENSIQETGAVNAVTGMILDYRAFDTFGESTVLFAAAISTLLLLKPNHGHREKDEPCDAILSYVGRSILPFILLFGIYVVVNGHLSPGGGFSGGAILGGGLILMSLVMGQREMDRLLSQQRITGVTLMSLMAYAGMKGYSFFTGANHIGWEIPKGNPGALLSGGFILPLNICVGIIVALTMYTFYKLFAQRGD